MSAPEPVTMINDNGIRRPATPAEADCHSPERRLLSARRGCLAQINEQVAQRIAKVWGKPARSDALEHAQMNASDRLAMLARRAGKPGAKGSDAAEIAEIEAKKDRTLAIVDASNGLAAAVRACTTEAEVMGILAVIEDDARWP